MEKLKKELTEIGLTRNESEIYLSLLRYGPMTSAEISRKTKVHRINVYSIVEKLQERGLISFQFISKRKMFQANSPKILKEIEELRRIKVDLIYQDLEKINKNITESPGAVVYMGKQGVKSIFEIIKYSKTPILNFTSGWGFRKNFPEYYSTWHSHLVLNNIKGRMLISSKFKDVKLLKPWSYRYLPSDFIFPTTTLVFENKVFIIIWEEPILGILITGDRIVESYKQYFEMLWKIAKPG